VTDLVIPDELNPEFDHQQLRLDPEAFKIVHALADAGVVTTVSLEVAADLPYEKRRLIAVYFGEMSRHLQWWVGDLLNDSEARDEHLFSQLAADTGLSEGALSTRMYVCRRVAVKRRRAGLPFSVHHAVASLGARDQERWLKIAEAEQLTSQVLRERIKAAAKDGQQELLDRDNDPPGPRGGLDPKLLEEAGRAILRDAKPADDRQHYLVPGEAIVRLRAAFDEEE
jgi:hypothetical protein